MCEREAVLSAGLLSCAESGPGTPGPLGVGVGASVAGRCLRVFILGSVFGCGRVRFFWTGGFFGGVWEEWLDGDLRGRVCNYWYFAAVSKIEDERI